MWRGTPQRVPEVQIKELYVVFAAFGVRGETKKTQPCGGVCPPCLTPTFGGHQDHLHTSLAR